MQLLIDASLPRSLSAVIRELGHDVLHVADVGLADSEDETIAAYAVSHDRTLLTADYDFSDVRNYPPSQYAGIVVFGLPRVRNSAIIHGIASAFMTEFGGANLRRKLVVVSKDRVRVRE